MQKTLWILMALIISAILVYQAGKWSGKQLADTSAASLSAQQEHTVIPAHAVLVATSSLATPGNSAVATSENAAVAMIATDSVTIPVAANSELEGSELAQLVQIVENKPTLHLTERLLSLEPEQLQHAMWQLELLSTNSSTYQRQQQLQQQFNDYALGTLLQLNCSDTLCIAMLQYADPQLRKAAMPLLSELATAEDLQATFLSKDHTQQHYSFFMLYGWR